MAYRRSNKCNAIKQILTANTRMDLMDCMQSRLEHWGKVPVRDPIIVRDDPCSITFPSRSEYSYVSGSAGLD